MRKTRLITLALGMLLVWAAPTRAATITITYTDSGWYDSFGEHTPANDNYVAGDIGSEELRNWFIFDLSSLSGSTITSATLALFNPDSPPGYTSPDATETYTLYDVSTDPLTIQAGGTGLFGIFNDLGTGSTFGSQAVSAADLGEIVLIPLNGDGVSALNGAIGGLFVIGGALTTLSSVETEFIFGFSGEDPSLIRELRLEVETANVVPEPTTFSLLAVGFATVAARRLRKRR